MTPTGLFKVDPERLVGILEQHRQEISQNWLSALQQKWAGPAQRKLTLLKQKIADHQDLLAMLLACSGETEAYYRSICSFINLDVITSQEYSVLDVFDEAVSLEDSILNLFQGLQISEDECEQLNGVVRQQILALMKGILGSTADLLASLVDGGMRGYCQVDAEGKIVCADREMQRLLGRQAAPGERLEHLFMESDRAFFTEVFSGQAKTTPGPQILHLDSRPQEPIPVGTEVCPIVVGGQQRGWYACLVDLRYRQQTELKVFENLPVGLARVDLKLNFRYVNRKFMEILELEDESWRGKALWDFLPDKEDREKVEQEVEKRRHGSGGEYEVNFTRESGRKVPVKIYAVPETDLKNKVIGSLAIIRSLERDKAIDRMHEHMATVEKWEEMLVQVIREVKPFIPYDLCLVSEISPDQKHIRRLLSEPVIENAMSHMGRWLVPDKMTQWLKKQREILIINDLEEFLSRPEFEGVKERPEVQWFIQQGYRASIRLPIIQEQPVASVSFMSKTKPYQETHRELLKALPIDKAVRMALYREKEEEFKFFLELIKKISAEGNDFRKVVEVLVDGLSDHYGWENVALFRADEVLSRFLLVHQKNKPGTPRLAEGYEQPLNQGVLGYVYRTGKDVISDNVKEDPRFKGVYVSGWKEPGSLPEKSGRSELCLRLATQNAYFILNIEDTKVNAFSDKEFEALEFFRDEAKEILERSWLYHSLIAARQLTSDAIIGTDLKGRITSFNRAAAFLLGYTEEEMQEKMENKEGLSLKDFFKDAKVAEKAITDRHFPSQKVVWLNKAKKPLNLLLSASALPGKEFGGKIFTAKNLADKDRVEHLEHLGKLYQEIAGQLKTPLSLAFAWLSRLAQKDPQSEEAKILEKVIKQLRKVDLTFDRLSLYDYDEKEGWFPTHKLLLSLDEVLRQVKNDLPESEWERIADASPRPLPSLQGDLFQLIFCVETILSHLLGVIPEDEKVQLQVSSPDGRIVMEFSGICPEIQDSQLSRALAAIALGKNIIRRFMKNHGGEYQEKKDGCRTIFTLNLPAAEGEQP